MENAKGGQESRERAQALALATADCLSGGGDMGAMMRQVDWASTPVGPVSGWSQPFRTMVGMVLRNRFPLSLWWGPQLVQFYNDPFRPILGSKHPAALAQSGSECWAEIWHIIGPMIEGPASGGPATGSEDLALLIHRSGFFEETHFRVAYSPVPDEAVPHTGIGGVLATVSETTAQVQSERQFKTLRSLATAASDARSENAAYQSAAATLLDNTADVPFALFYAFQASGEPALLAACSGFGKEAVPARPLTIDVSRDPDSAHWPLRSAFAGRSVEVLDVRDPRFGALPMGPWAEPPRSAIVLSLAAPDQQHPYGVMIAGISPHRQLDEGYRSFFELAAAQVVTGIRNARAYEDERKHAAALAKLDQAKTTFFSNVSHEFRTPLALMIGPTEDALSSPSQALNGDALAMVHRNELRLLKLVNSLLDFARMEAGRIEASYQATDLARLTADLASVFRAAMERGGLRLVVVAPPLPLPVFVDREMWEKIVLNLLSNAFKHTFEGEVEVSLTSRGDFIELVVRDTGVGIPAEELPRIFDRFHRVRDARARSHEGTGIGLALVSDLVKLHGGTLEAESQVGRGTRITVSIPAGSAHLPVDRIGAAKGTTSTAVAAAAYVNDALSWLPADDARGESPSSPADAPAMLDGAVPARLLLADDNADMREYVRRLLSRHWTVQAVADGQQALEAIRRQPPSLLVADVMMPGLDGLGLTRALRANPGTKGLPIILLSARTGDEAVSEGLDAGANDYIVKPFSARELVARVRVQLEIAHSREREREHEIARLVDDQFRQIAAATSHAKDEFLAILGHELRNPLAPILTALELMKMRGDESSAKERGVIERQVKHVVRLVDDLLDVSRMTRGKVNLDKQSVGMNAIIASAIETASPLLEQRKHRLITEVMPSELTLDADPFRLAQILSNLLTNAAKYTDPGGTISIFAGIEGEMVVLRVRDTGIGIEPELLPRMFEAFAQSAQASDRAQGGLGLGLAIVKSLVALHGGQVEAHSAGPGRGSEFVVRLPVADEMSRASPVLSHPLPAASTAATAPDATVRSRVLVVDDNVDAADLLGEMLRRRGHEVVIAHDGAAALRARQTFCPDVALLDIGLPVMDGYELAQHLRALYPNAPLRIIAVTGYGEAKDRARSKAAGFDEHLVKPVDGDRVCELLAMPPPPLVSN